MTMNTSTSKKSLFNGRKLWFILSIAAALGAALVVFIIMSSLSAKDTYYVLSEDIPARTQIDPTMLVEVQTAANSAPPNAIGLSDLTGEQYSLYSLKAGDILTSSNTGDLLTLNEGLPKDFVISSFIASPSMAAGGNIKRGDYVDIIAVVEDSAITGSEGPAASYILQRVLVIDATVDLDSYSGGEEASTTGEDGTVSENTNDPAMRAGIPTMFTVGVSPENAAVLAVASQFQLYAVLSSAEATIDEVLPTGLVPVDGISLWGNPRNGGEGTDNTFGQGGEKDTTTKPTEPTTPSTPGPEESTEPSTPDGETDNGETPVEDGGETPPEG